MVVALVLLFLNFPFFPFAIDSPHLTFPNISRYHLNQRRQQSNKSIVDDERDDDDNDDDDKSIAKNAASVREKQRRKRETRWQKWILQFGKIGEDVYTMDFRYPFTPLQAFMVCATSLDKKLGCE